MRRLLSSCSYISLWLCCNVEECWIPWTSTIVPLLPCIFFWHLPHSSLLCLVESDLFWCVFHVLVIYTRSTLHPHPCLSEGPHSCRTSLVCSLNSLWYLCYLCVKRIITMVDNWESWDRRGKQMSGASRRQQSDVYSDRIIVRSLPWRGEMHEYKKSGGSKESQDHHETEQSVSLPVQLSYPLLLFSVCCHSGKTTTEH